MAYGLVYNFVVDMVALIFQWNLSNFSANKNNNAVQLKANYSWSVNCLIVARSSAAKGKNMKNSVTKNSGIKCLLVGFQVVSMLRTSESSQTLVVLYQLYYKILIHII